MTTTVNVKVGGKTRVVIDPEDREQIDALVKSAWPIARNKTSLTDHLQAALRSLVAPPKPPEPQGLGAVVETAGGRFVRSDVMTTNPWRGPTGVPHDWDDIADCVVRVLSEGVTE